MKKVLYFVWINVDPEIENDWVKYIDNTHIPDVLKTNYFLSARRAKAMEGKVPGTHLVIFECKDKKNFDLYLKNDAERLRKDHTDHFGSKISSTRYIFEESFSMNLS